MEILYFDELPSTQLYLIEAIKKKKLSKNVAVIAKRQSNGIGSRGNRWEAKEGDLLFSFAIEKEKLPNDLAVSSASIYFAYLLKELISKDDKEVFLKWPNDFYKIDKKCGGVVTNFFQNTFVVGIGVNLVPRDENYGYVKLKNSVNSLLESYFLLLEKAPKWQEIFSKFRLEFKRSFEFFVHVKGKKTSLKNATLLNDGSIMIDNERIYSLR